MKGTIDPRIGVAALCAAVVAVAGCSGYAAPPDGYRPDSRFGCPELVGDYRIAAAPEATAWMAVQAVGGVSDWFALSIEPDPLGRGLRMALRRDPAQVLREAAALRERSPADYARWREQVRYALHVDPARPGRGYGEGILRKHGPAVEVTHGFAVSDACKSGWAPAPNAESSRLFARGERGELLMQIRRYREFDTDWSFFGTPFSYPRYHRTDWYRLQPLPPGTAVRLDAAALTAAAPRAAPRATAEDNERATRALAAEADAILRRALPAGVAVTLLRPTQFDPQALALAPHAVRMEIAGTFDAAADPDPFQQLLRGLKRVEAIELRRRAPQGAGRAYALVRFTWRAAPDGPR